MKKAILLILCVALVICGASAFSEYFYGSTGIMESGSIDIMGIKAFENGGKEILLEDPQDETEEKLIEILSKAERKNRRSFGNKPIEGLRTDYEIELYFLDIYEHRFLYLGEKSSIYDPKSGKSWEVINADEILPELEAFLS